MKSRFRFTWPRTNNVCEVCEGTMTAGQLGRHFACDGGTIVGHACVCPPECSRTYVGDGPSACDPECRVCRLKRGTPVKALAK